MTPPAHITDRATARARAKVLHAALQAAGRPISHGQALELVARQAGARDWNSLAARLGPPLPGPGARVTGRYLGRRFSGRVISAEPLPDRGHRLQLVLDRPVDTIRFAGQSNLRHRITAEVDPRGRSPSQTSDGAPHLIIHRLR